MQFFYPPKFCKAKLRRGWLAINNHLLIVYPVYHLRQGFLKENPIFAERVEVVLRGLNFQGSFPVCPTLLPSDSGHVKTASQKRFSLRTQKFQQLTASCISYCSWVFHI
jgi:hypothetical protein